MSKPVMHSHRGQGWCLRGRRGSSRGRLAFAGNKRPVRAVYSARAIRDLLACVELGRRSRI